MFYRIIGIKSFFFCNPSECVRKEIRNISFNDTFKFLVLLLLLRSKNRQDHNFFELIVGNPTDTQLPILQFLDISSSRATVSEVYKAINALKYVFVTSLGWLILLYTRIITGKCQNSYPNNLLLPFKYIDIQRQIWNVAASSHTNRC